MELFSFISTAFAQSAQQAKPGVFETLVLPLGGFMIIMYFLVIRPQQKKMKDHDALLGGLKAGDEVVTSGGIIGIVKSVADTFVSIDVGGGQQIKVVKANVSSLTKAKT